jgi:hypothetical protein
VSAVAEVKLERVPKRVNRERRTSMLASGEKASEWLVVTAGEELEGLDRDEQWSSVLVVWSLHCCSW